MVVVIGASPGRPFHQMIVSVDELRPAVASSRRGVLNRPFQPPVKRNPCQHGSNRET